MTQHEFLNQVLLGNKSAVDFCKILFNVSQVLDDLIDKDKEITDEEIFKSYWLCLIDLPSNPFYIKHAPMLVPLMQAFMVDYRDSVTLERAKNYNAQNNDHGKNIAFTLRDSIGSVVTHCALMVGGYDHMAAVSAQIRLFIFDESLEDYKEALCQEAAQAPTLKIQS